MKLAGATCRRLIAGICVLAGFRLPAAPAQIPVDRDLVRNTVESLAVEVHREYVDAETAARVDTALHQRLAEGRYAGVEALEGLASMLTHDLFELTRDRHLSVAVVPDRGPSPPGGTQPAESRETIARRSNFGIQRVEILPGNIGYINITWFYRPDEARSGAANPGRPYPLNARFEATVPNGKVRSAVGGGNWEGVGVTPDLKTAAAEALRVAHLHALRQSMDRTPAGPWRDTLEREIRTLDKR